MAVAVTRIMFHRGTEETSPILREIILKTSNYGGPYMQCTNIFFQCTTYIYSVHKCISECTNLFLSAQINFSVHKLIFQCTNLFLSAQMYFSVHKCDSQCTIVFSQNKCIFSAQIYFSVHKCISQCINLFLSAQMYFSVHNYISQCLVTWFPVHFCCSVGTFCSCYLPCKSIGLREYFNSTLESMFCSCCGAQVQISFSFCPSCGGSLKSNNEPDCISRVENVGRETAAINSRKRASSSILTRPDLLRAKLPTYEQFASKKSDERRGHFKVFLEAKVTLSDCRNFFPANRQ